MAQPQRKAVVLLLEVLYRNRRVDPADVHRACRTFLAQETRSLEAQLHVRNGVGAGGIGAALPHARKENALPAAHDDSVLLCHGLPHYLLERQAGKAHRPQRGISRGRSVCRGRAFCHAFHSPPVLQPRLQQHFTNIRRPSPQGRAVLLQQSQPAAH